VTSLAANAQVNIYSDDPESLAAFYGALGLSEKFRFPTTGKPDQIELSVGSLTLGFTSRAALEKLAGLRTDPGPPQSEVVLWCEDAVALYARTLELGAHPVAAPRVFNGRLQCAWIEDPERNRVKLVSYFSYRHPTQTDV
jgi:predicted enzyme related to lactoylglutathione lyase